MKWLKLHSQYQRIHVTTLTAYSHGVLLIVHRGTQLCRSSQQFWRAEVASFIVVPETVQPTLHRLVRLPLATSKTALRHKRHLDVDERRLFVQQWRQLVYVELATACFDVQPMMPTLDIVVRPHRFAVDVPGRRRPSRVPHPRRVEVTNNCATLPSLFTTGACRRISNAVAICCSGRKASAISFLTATPDHTVISVCHCHFLLCSELTDKVRKNEL